MKKEVVVTARTLEQAIEIGAKKLNLKEEYVSCELLERGKKGFLGIGSTENKFKVSGRMSNGDVAVEFIEKIIGHMKISAMPKIIEETKDEIKIDIIGDNLGTLIGYHGEILDSLQYLTYLAVNKDDDINEEPESAEDKAEDKGDKYGAVKISLDIENYRKKREETLQSLAKKMAERVLKYGRSVVLEPMNAYERRIIHATVQEIPGVNTHSVGQENDRKIIISKELSSAPPARPSTGFSSQKRPYQKPAPYGDRNNRTNDRGPRPERSPSGFSNFSNRPKPNPYKDRNFKKQ